MAAPSSADLTVPRIVAVVTCARAIEPNQQHTTIASKKVPIRITRAIYAPIETAINARHRHVASTILTPTNHELATRPHRHLIAVEYAPVWAQ